MKLASQAFLCGLTLLAVATAGAQQFPTKPIHIVITYPPGTTYDGAGRPVATEMQKRLGQPVVFEYKPGANTTIGAKYVAGSPPDGHTLLFSSPITAHQLLNKNNALDAARELTPISLVSNLPYFVVARSSLPVTTIQELAAYSKANPGKLTHGVAAVTQDLVMTVIADRIGAASRSIPFKASAQITVSMLNSEVDLAISSVQAFLPHIQAGTMRALVITAPKRSAGLPNVPTSAEAGMPGLVVGANFGLWAPAGTPREIVQRLNAEVVAALKLPDVVEQIRKGSGSDAVGSSPEDLMRNFQDEVRFWTEASKIANFQPQ